jgi:hypothetical protein
MSDDEQTGGVHPYPVQEPRAYDPVRRSRAARIASNMRWALEPDRVGATQPMRDAQQRKFEDLVDPERVLDPVEREKRVVNAKRAYYTRLAAKSAATRAARKGKR